LLGLGLGCFLLMAIGTQGSPSRIRNSVAPGQPIGRQFNNAGAALPLVMKR